MRRVALFHLIAAAACATPSTPPDDGDSGGAPRAGAVVQDGIEYRGDVAVMESFPVQLAGRVTITNRGDSARTIVFPDGCVVLLRAYQPGEPTPIWDQATEVACTMALVEMELGPGESQEVGTPTASAADVLGTDHPDGIYRIAIYLRPDQERVEIDAGTVELAVPR